VPAFGPAAGNNIVIVSGTGFVAGATVSFGGIPATAVTVVNPTSLTAKSPTHSAGLVTVSVTNPSSQIGSLANAYRYLVASGQLSFQYFPITVPDVAVTDITAGPDGNLWFLTNGGKSLNPDGLAKMTPSGTFTNYPLADPGLLRDIAPGPDGNVWYVRQRPDKIGRVTPSGVATEFLNGSGRSYEGIAAGPDGAMWVTTAGYLTLYPSGSTPPLASVINFRAGQTRANNAIVPFGVFREIGRVVWHGRWQFRRLHPGPKRILPVAVGPVRPAFLSARVPRWRMKMSPVLRPRV
jgi:streptogramin lyase